MTKVEYNKSRAMSVISTDWNGWPYYFLYTFSCRCLDGSHSNIYNCICPHYSDTGVHNRKFQLYTRRYLQHRIHTYSIHILFETSWLFLSVVYFFVQSCCWWRVYTIYTFAAFYLKKYDEISRSGNAIVNQRLVWGSNTSWPRFTTVY